MKDVVCVVRDVRLATLKSLLRRYGLSLTVQDSGESITGSFWGDSEAGRIGAATTSASLVGHLGPLCVGQRR